MKHFSLKNTWTLLLLVFLIPSCDLLNKGEEDEDSGESISFTFFDVPGTNPDTNNLMAILRPEDGLHVSFFGRGGQISSILTANENEGTEHVMLLDEYGVPAFSYQVNTITGEKLESLVEFEKISEESFYMRFFHYDWEKRIGTLLSETIHSLDSSGEWITDETFVTRNTSLDGINARIGKGQSFAHPIARLDKIGKRTRITSSGDAIQDFIDGIDDFRSNVVSKFLREKVRPVGAAAILAGALISTPAGGVLLIGGAALVGTSYAVDFFMNDGWERLVSGYQGLQNSFSEGINEFSGGTINLLNSYSESTSELWNSLNQSNDNLEDILESLEDNNIFPETMALDDLPDSDGVVHISLNWDTPATDIDLWVTDPNGEKIYYETPTSSSGGYLDLDDVDGFGPENIYWGNGAPEGKYYVKVHYFGCDSEPHCAPTTVQVKVSNGVGTVKTFSQTLYNVDDIVTIVEFEKVNSELFF